MSMWYIIGVIILLFVVTMLTRGLPFLFGAWIVKQRILMMLGQQLPAAIIFMLMVYYMMMLAKPTHWHNLTWQIVALILIVALQWRYKKTIVSLLVGTALYLLLQGVT